MTARSAGCRRVGAVVRAKLKAVTSDAECKRRFGTEWMTKTVTGTVVEVVTPPKGSGKQASVIVDWQVGSQIKRKSVKIMNVRLELPPVPPPVATVTPQIPVEVTSELSEVQPQVPMLAGTQEPDEVEVHGLTWKIQGQEGNVNRYTPVRPWKVTFVTGASMGENQGSNGMTPYDYFTWMFPMSHLAKIVTMTNANLILNNKGVTDASEILRFFGIIILMSRFEFGPRRDLWETKSDNKYIPATNFALFMKHHRFETLRANIRFSNNGSNVDDGMPNRWALVDDFVTAINRHREMFVTPSDLICVDESMSRWYGLGGDWIDVGLPTYRAIDRKPENGCEIKNSACGRSGIMLRMEIVKSPVDVVQDEAVHGLSHGAAVTKRLVDPWSHSNRIVCGDSYFASVHTAQVLKGIGLGFIGVVKTAHRKFPLKYLGSLPIDGRGKWVTMIHKDVTGGCDLAAVLWVDRERRYFVASSGSTLPGSTIYRTRWRKVGTTSLRTVTETAIPQIAETYYEAASQIDRHNRCRQHDLNLEKKI